MPPLPPETLELPPQGLRDPRTTPFAAPRWRGDLPHLHKEGCTYFVTFCLLMGAGARPRRREAADDEPMFEHVIRRAEPPTLSPDPLLATEHAAGIVESALLHFHGKRYLLHAWVVMPDHVHVVVTPLPGHELSAILHSWKSYTAKAVNRRFGRSGTLWESESFDHVVRSQEHLERFIGYVEANPVAAGLCAVAHDWSFGSARARREHREDDRRP